MKRRSVIITTIVLSILILSVFLNMVIVMPLSKAPNTNQFADGTTELIVDFPAPGIKSLLVPADANVTKVTVNFTTMADSSGRYPENIELRFGEILPIDWAFQGSGHGAFGFQRYFKESQVRINMTYDETGYNNSYSLILPKNAQVSQASVKLTAFE